MDLNLNSLVTQELEQREELKKLVMGYVFTLCEPGKGYIKRGVLNQFVYEGLGFHGQYGNHFGRFMKKLMAENGFRVSYSSGQRVFYGLKEKPCEQLILPDSSSEN
jgi:hypothetical protein